MCKNANVHLVVAMSVAVATWTGVCKFAVGLMVDTFCCREILIRDVRLDFRVCLVCVGDVAWPRFLRVRFCEVVCRLRAPIVFVSCFLRHWASCVGFLHVSLG